MVSFTSALLNGELADHIATAKKSLVQVQAGRNGAGSGVIIHADGLIITNAHVVRRSAPRVVLSDGEELSARILAYDEEYDLAALSVKGDALPALRLGDSRQLRPGSLVVALGHPLGVVGAATAGMVIGVGRPVEPLPYRGELIQVGLHLRPGHSGGPMLDAAGELVGINTMIAGPHVGLAVPTNTVNRFLQENLGGRNGAGHKRRPQAIPA